MVDEPTVYSATKQLSQKGKEKLFNILTEYIDAKIDIRTLCIRPSLNQERVEDEMQKAKWNLQNMLNNLKIEVE